MGLRRYQLLGDSALTLMECCSCGVTFGITQELESLRRKDRVGFYCPNGHVQSFRGESPDEKRIRELEIQLRQKTEQADVASRAREWAEKQAKGANIAAGLAKAAKRKLEHRVNCGVCPHCRRTFRQLAAHMKTKHPGKR